MDFENIFPNFIDISNLRIPFPSKREADVAYNVLRVDKEPERSGVKKTLELLDNILVV